MRHTGPTSALPTTRAAPCGADLLPTAAAWPPLKRCLPRTPQLMPKAGWPLKASPGRGRLARGGLLVPCPGSQPRGWGSAQRQNKVEHASSRPFPEIDTDVFFWSRNKHVLFRYL